MTCEHNDKHPLSKKARNRVFELVKPWSSRRRLHDLETFLAFSNEVDNPASFRSTAFDKKLAFAKDVKALISNESPAFSGETYKEHASIRLQTEEWQDKSALQVLFGHHFRDSGIVNIDFGTDLNAISHIIDAISGKSANPHIVFTVGIGGYPHLPSIRLPAHVVRPLEAMRKLKYFAKKHGSSLKVELHIFRANHMAVKVNDFSLKEVTEASTITIQFLEAFVNKFYGDISGDVIIESDYPLNRSEKANDILEEATSVLKNLPTHQRYLDSIRRMGHKHGEDSGSGNSYYYASAHPFYNGSILAPELDIFRPSLKRINTDSIIIDYGGRPQHTFNQLGRVLIEHFSQSFPVPSLVNVLHTACKTPGYDLLKDKDGNITDIPLGVSQTSPLEIKLYGRYFTDMRTIYSHVDEALYKEFLATSSW